MNELKIRMWNKENKKMLYPKTLQELLSIEFDEGYRMGSMAIVNFNPRYNNLEFMLFSGLYDKNKKEVYESDVIECKFDGREYHGEVYYDELICAFLCGNNELYLWELEDIEIVGNIFENDKGVKAF